MKPLVLTPGDPLGVGPELAARVLARPDREAKRADVVLAGDGDAITRACEQAGVAWMAGMASSDPGRVRIVDTAGGAEPAEVAALRWSVGRILAGEARGLVTGPIHKARLRDRGFTYSGHTDFLGALCGRDRPVMAFVGGKLRVALVTVHIPLAEVSASLSVDAITHTVRTAHAALERDLGLASPRIAILGLNPHAGESGVLGREELDVIGPAVATARQEGIDARGPVSAETAFLQALDGKFDMIVAMYHDQGLAPLKLVDFGRSVNWTLGLPIVRTSVDHGTADDIAWTGKADPSSMEAALCLAEQLTSR